MPRRRVTSRRLPRTGPVMAVTSGRNTAPARAASPTRAASSTERDSTLPLGRCSVALRCRAWSSNAVSGRAPQAGMSPPSPASSSTPRATPPRQEPHTLLRGQLDRSTRSTECPARASPRAAMAPAGPAPMTRASHRAAIPERGRVILVRRSGVPSARTARARPGARLPPVRRGRRAAALRRS